MPFTSINYGTCTLPEGRMVTQEILKVTIEGLGKNGVTSIFPCQIFQYKKGINDKPGTPNYDLKRLALEATTKRIYPNYGNCDWNNNTNAFILDRKQKQEYIDSLSKSEQKNLLEIFKANKEIAYKLGIETEEGLKVSLEERPIEGFSTMGCRTVNLFDINGLDNFKTNIQHILSGEFDKIDDVFSSIQKDGRGNICPVTIIMPTLAAITIRKMNKKFENADLSDEAKKEVIFREFMNLLDKKIHEAKDMLLERFNHITSQSWKSGKFMYTNHTMTGYHPDEGIISALKHGTIVIGQLGLSETLYILFGFDHTTEEGMKYAKEIEKMFNVRCSEFKNEYKLNFGVYLTPAENLCHTAFKKFCKEFPDFDIEGVTWFTNEDGKKEYKNYFTNSIHVPVYHQCDPFEKIDIESQLTGYSNAGCITYVELPSVSFNNLDAIEEIVDYSMEHDLPYFAINFPLDTCEDCGERIYEQNDICPKCGSKNIKRLARITGYLSQEVSNFNKGKEEEYYDRIRHIKN